MLCLYNNGLTEELSPLKLFFSDQEILEFFKGFNNIQTKRLIEIPNTWCVWGELKNPDEEDYNKLASEIIQEHCYSKLFLLHDTEVDPSWNLTDSLIYDNYNIFKRKILEFIDIVAAETIREMGETRNTSEKPKSIVLDPVGISDDKRVIFKFNPDKQQPDFFHISQFNEFANKSFNFLDKFYKNGDNLPIYADKKMIVILDDFQVKQYIDFLIDFFKEQEDYLKCARINGIYQSWIEYKEKTKKISSKKRGRPKKKLDNSNDISKS
jgi:hypothetical protein